MKTLRGALLPPLATVGLAAALVLSCAQAGWSAETDTPAPRDPGRYAERMERYRAELHDKLKLTPQQENAWRTFTERTKAAAAPWPRDERAELASLTAPERMERMLARMKEFEGRMAERLAAVKEFYAVLTPEQRKVFDEQFDRLIAQRHHHCSRLARSRRP